MTKLYCFVDETGQDTEGKFFLVAIVLKDATNLENLESKLTKLEINTGKKQLKWGKSPYAVRQNYLLAISQIKELRGSIYYSVYHHTKIYSPLISLSIAKAVFATKHQNYQVKIVIDGLSKKGIEEVRHELKRLTIRYNKVKGLKDEQSVFLRLADAIAGFLRDFQEGQKYTRSIFKKFLEKEMLIQT